MVKEFVNKHSDFLRYVLVGGFNTIFDIALFTVLANVIQIHPILSNVMSTVIVMTISFFLNYHFVFKSQNNKVKSAVQFVIATLFNGWVVQSIIIWIVINIGNTIIVDENILNFVAKICGVAVGMISNFLMYRYIFRNKKTVESMVK